MVTLEDGTTISIADLKTNNMFQRVFTKKTEELKAEKIALHEEHQRKVSEAENEIRQKRDLILENWQLIVPKEPVYDPNDPVSFLEETAAYNERMKTLNNLWQQKQQEAQKTNEQQQAQANEFIAAQKQLLVQKLPHLKDEGKREAFKKDISDIGGKVYGITSEEVGSIADARYIQILHDAIAYQKLKAKRGATVAVGTASTTLADDTAKSVRIMLSQKAKRALKKVKRITFGLRAIANAGSASANATLRIATS
jgi:hypothetical protein